MVGRGVLEGLVSIIPTLKSFITPSFSGTVFTTCQMSHCHEHPKILVEFILSKKYFNLRNYLFEVFMSDRKKNAGWRAENPNRHKREIDYTLFGTSLYFAVESKKKITKDKTKRKYS